LKSLPFGENYLSARSAFPRGSCVLNLKSQAQVVLKRKNGRCACAVSRDL